MVVATLQENDPETGERLDLQGVATPARGDPRTSTRSTASTVHIIGFAKAMGDIASGAAGVLVFFGLAFVITALLLYWYSGSLVITTLALICAVVPVIWLLGLLPLFGLGLDPMSILVPFLIFSIAVSHAVQMTNAWKLETLHGADGVTASTHSFQKLFIPGAMALLANALGFMVIAFVDIEIVRELAYTATIGVTVMILTNKMLLPILLSYYRFTPEQASKLAGKETAGDWLWERIGRSRDEEGGVGRRCSSGLGAARVRHLAGAPPAHRRPRQGRARAARGLALQPGRRHDHEPFRDRRRPAAGHRRGESAERGRLAVRRSRRHGPHRGFRVPDAPGRRRGDGPRPRRVRQEHHAVVCRDVRQVAHAARGARADRAGHRLRHAARQRVHELALHRDAGQHLHDAITRRRRSSASSSASRHSRRRGGDTDKVTFRLASGNVGVMAATNEAVEAADKWVNLALFVSVMALCLLAFRSLPITLCVVLPLALVTVLCNALMAMLGIGVKVNTLPVVALGVGVGVDYGIYLFERMKHEMEDNGLKLKDAFVEALKQRGTASVFTAVTMTVSVATWMFSALKFQADMGILLAFMFLVNTFGAILLLPALAAYLVGDRKRPQRTPSPRRHGRSGAVTGCLLQAAARPALTSA